MPKPKKNESKQDYLKRCTADLIDREGRGPEQAFAMCNAFWDDAKGTRNSLSLTAPFTLEKKEGDGDEGKKRAFMITAYTGQVIDMGWFGKYIFEVKGMKAKEKFPVLREHARERVVGIASKTWKDGSNFYIGGEFVDSTADGKEVLDLATEGFPWQASVGIWPKTIRRLESEKEKATVNGQEITGPAEIWLESSVGEVSFVALGADDQTAAIVLSDKSVPVRIIGQTINEEENVMAEITIESLQKDAPDLLKQIREAAMKEGSDAERARVAAILEADADLAITRQAIKDGVSAEAAFKLFYEAEKTKRTTALKELETSAPPSAGSTPPKEPEKKEDPKKELMARAKKLALEKKITVAQAMKQVQLESPELVDASLPKFHMVVND